METIENLRKQVEAELRELEAAGARLRKVLSMLAPNGSHVHIREDGHLTTETLIARVSDALRKSDDGLAPVQLARSLHADYSAVYKVLYKNPKKFKRSDGRWKLKQAA